MDGLPSAVPLLRLAFRVMHGGGREGRQSAEQRADCQGGTGAERERGPNPERGAETAGEGNSSREDRCDGEGSPFASGDASPHCMLGGEAAWKQNRRKASVRTSLSIRANYLRLLICEGSCPEETLTRSALAHTKMTDFPLLDCVRSAGQLGV